MLPLVVAKETIDHVIMHIVTTLVIDLGSEARLKPPSNYPGTLIGPNTFLHLCNTTINYIHASHYRFNKHCNYVVAQVTAETIAC